MSGSQELDASRPEADPAGRAPPRAARRRARPEGIARGLYATPCLALLLLGARAAAEPVTVTDDDVAWTLDLPDGWTAADAPQPADGRVLAAYASGSRRLAIAKMRGTTDGAYQGDAAFFAGVEEGVAKEDSSYRRLAGTVRALGRRHKLPAYDLWYRAGSALRGARFIFMKNYVVLLTMELPGTRAIDRGARRLLESFGPAR